MKKRVTIHVFIDDVIGEPSAAGVVPKNYQLPNDPVAEEYIAFLHAPYDHAGEGAMADTIPNRLDIAAHEFGHILSGIFNSKGGVRSDPRMKTSYGLKEMFFGPSEAEAMKLWCSELQAWSIAEKIRPELDQIRKGQSLATYRIYLDHAERIRRRKERRARRGSR